MGTNPPTPAAPDALVDLDDLAARYDLPRLGGRPALAAYVGKLWQRRHFTVELARARFTAARSQDRLGLAWVVLGPLLNAAVYFLVFGVLLTFRSRFENYAAFLLTGVFLFQFFTASLNAGAKSITGNLGMVRALHFPRASLPIAAQLQQLFTVLPMLLVLVLLVLASGENPSPRWLLLIPVVLLQLLFNSGVAFFVARATVHVRDITQLLPLVSRLLFYTSGIFFDLSRVGDDLARSGTLSPERADLVQGILELNPLYLFVSLARGALIEGHAAPAWMWAAAAAWSIALFVAGFLFFWRAEARYGRG